jgi:hypothetical protein
MPFERDTDSERLARLHVLDELRATADDLHTLAKLAQEKARRRIAETQAIRDQVAQARLSRQRGAAGMFSRVNGGSVVGPKGKRPF